MNTRLPLPALLLTLGFGGCAAGPPGSAPASPVPAASAAPAASAPFGEPTGERRVRYACPPLHDIEVRYFPLQGVAVLVRDGTTAELQQQLSGSGFIYGSGPNTIRGKGDELILELDRRAPIRCKAR